MVGAIRTRDILAHPFVTIQCFGWVVFFRALTAGRGETFLSLLAKTSVFRTPLVKVPELLEHCVELERRARQLYEALSARFADQEPVRKFFETLAGQEQEHYEMLELCRQLAGQEGWLEEHFAPWRDAVPRLERQMEDAEADLAGLDSVEDSLRLVIRIEGSEINQVFEGAVAATDSVFVRALDAFRTAEEKHLSYICDRVPSFQPELAGECEALRADRLGAPRV